jgi:hypothetical protein
MLMGGNIDVQFLLGNSAKASAYSLKYVCKSEKDNPDTMNTIKQIVHNFIVPASADGNDEAGMRAMVSTVMNALTVGRGFGDWEVSIAAQGMPLTGVSHTMRSLNLSGSCLIPRDEECSDDDDLNPDAEPKQVNFSNDFKWYNSRPDGHSGDCMFRCKEVLTEMYKESKFVTGVNLRPFLKCKMVDFAPQIATDASREAQQAAREKLENWAQHKLLIFVPWRVNEELAAEELIQAAVDEVRGDHESCLAAIQAALPAWVKAIEAQLEARESPLHSPPLEYDSGVLPRIVTWEWYHALFERGYPPPDVDEDDDSKSSSETEDPVESDDESPPGSDIGGDNDEVFMDPGDGHDANAAILHDEETMLVPLLAATFQHVLASNEVNLTPEQVDDACDWLQRTKEEHVSGHGVNIALNLDEDYAEPDSLNAKQKEVYNAIVASVTREEQLFAIVQGEGD